MNFDQMEAAIRDAQNRLSVADRVAGRLVSMLVGRLRKVSNGYVLGQLKKELTKFNRQTNTWSD